MHERRIRNLQEKITMKRNNAASSGNQNTRPSTGYQIRSAKTGAYEFRPFQNQDILSQMSSNPSQSNFLRKNESDVFGNKQSFISLTSQNSQLRIQRNKNFNVLTEEQI